MWRMCHHRGASNRMNTTVSCMVNAYLNLLVLGFVSHDAQLCSVSKTLNRIFSL